MTPEQVAQVQASFQKVALRPKERLVVVGNGTKRCCRARRGVMT